MEKKLISPQIDFAKRHITQSVSTFNAASALYRLKDLIYGAQDMKEKMLKLSDDEDFHPWPYEIDNYYTVGFVTCLEWHARSRLYDLYVFDPRVIEASDIKQNISDSKLVQMLSENLTIAHLIAGSTNVSTYERYVGIFSKIFDRIGANIKISDLVKSIEIEGEIGNAQKISDMYDLRNKLVHEIDITRIGHYNIREGLHLSDVIELGKLVELLIKSIEDVIRKFAPSEFPNLLNDDYYAVDENTFLREKIIAIEHEIGEAIVEDRFIGEMSIIQWNGITSASAEYIDMEIAVMSNLDMPGLKYHDIRPFMIRNILHNRLEYLQILAKEMIVDPY